MNCIEAKKKKRQNRIWKVLCTAPSLSNRGWRKIVGAYFQVVVPATNEIRAVCLRHALSLGQFISIVFCEGAWIVFKRHWASDFSDTSLSIFFSDRSNCAKCVCKEFCINVSWLAWTWKISWLDPVSTSVSQLSILIAMRRKWEERETRKPQLNSAIARYSPDKRC